MFRRLIAAALAVASTVLLSSCLDYDEELIIHNNLSGEAYVTLTLPDMLISKYERIGIELDRAKIEKRLETVSGVHLASYERTDDRLQKVKMLFKFTSLDKLNEAIAANPPAAIWAGQFTVTKENGQTKVDRKLGVGDAGNDLPQFNSALYKTHFDGTIAATNSPQYNSPAKDVRYRYSLSEMLSRNPTQSTTFVKGWPWTLILLSLAAIGGAAWYGWEYFGKKKDFDLLHSPSPAEDPDPEVSPSSPLAPETPQSPGRPQLPPPGAPPEA
jgi:hypothetical protein